MEWGNALGAAVSGVFGLVGSAKQFEYAKELAAQQNQYNIDMWKMQADYNSPQSQMRRFEKAGLNPNLIYGQGSNGNMSQPPVQTVPAPPEISEHMARIGQAFNIEGLRTTIANRKKAQAEAKSAQLDADKKEMDFESDKELGALYHFDDNTGSFVLNPVENWYAIDNHKAMHYYNMRKLSRNYHDNYLIIPRRNLTITQDKLLQPQVRMNQYEQRFQPWSFWIGNGTKVINSLVPLFK